MGMYEAFLWTMLLSGGWMICICLLQPKGKYIERRFSKKKKFFRTLLAIFFAIGAIGTVIVHLQ